MWWVISRAGFNGHRPEVLALFSMIDRHLDVLAQLMWQVQEIPVWTRDVQRDGGFVGAQQIRAA